MDIVSSPSKLLVMGTAGEPGPSKVFMLNPQNASEIMAIIPLPTPEFCQKMAIHGSEMYSAHVCSNDNTGVWSVILVSYLSSDPVWVTK